MMTSLHHTLRSHRTKPFVVAFACSILALAAVATNSHRAVAQAVPRIFSDVAIAPSFGATIPPDLHFVDADGRDVRSSELFSDRPVILHLVYYECPMLCKLSSDGLLRALSTLTLTLGEDFSIITVSFDPREGPELSARARSMAIEKCGRTAVENGWKFLTGDAADIDELCQAVGFRYTWDAATGQFAHASGAFILTADGTLSRYLSGVEFAPRDLRLALVEASAGKVGTATDQVLLMCYMYDPSAGKYGVAIMTAVRLAGIVTVGVMGLAIFTMLRRERQRRSGFRPDLESNLSGWKA
jgi:protein SCO1/2